MSATEELVVDEHAEELSKVQEKIRERAANFGREMFRCDSSRDEVEPVSDEWSPFLGGPIQAKWVPTEKHDCTLILFDVPETTTIDFHAHKATESFIVVGDVTIYTPNGTQRLREGDAIRIEETRPHAAEFHEDTLLNMMWSPQFKPDPEAPARRVLYESEGISVQDEHL